MVFNSSTGLHTEVSSYADALTQRAQFAYDLIKRISDGNGFSISQKVVNADGSETWTGLDLSNNELTIVTQNANSDPILAVANTANT